MSNWRSRGQQRPYRLVWTCRPTGSSNEALTNVLKHAGPRASVRVDVVRGTESLTITVSDDGRGEINGAGRPTGHGLLGIRERVAVVGGRVEAGPDEDGGFVVRAQLPYAVEA